MKKPLIDIKKINNNDVIATSGCSVALNDYDMLFQSNGKSNNEYAGYFMGVTSSNSFEYNNGNWGQVPPEYVFAYFSNEPEMEDGKWYHLLLDEQARGSLIECTDPNHHGCSSN